MVNLGFMELPLSGPLNFMNAVGGMLVGYLCVAALYVYCAAAGLVGAAAVEAESGAQLFQAVRLSAAVTTAWTLLYYNQIGANLCTVFAKGPFKMIDPESITEPAFGTVPPRYAGNMQEHSVAFIAMLWTYTLFVDANTGGFLGVLYLLMRLVYPIVYSHQGQFTFIFEYFTQIGYAVIGCFMLGVFVNCYTGDLSTYAAFLKSGGASLSFSGAFLAALAGFLLGSAGLFPGAPLGPIYAAIHYGLHRKYHFEAPALKKDLDNVVAPAPTKDAKDKGA